MRTFPLLVGAVLLAGCSNATQHESVLGGGAAQGGNGGGAAGGVASDGGGTSGAGGGTLPGQEICDNHVDDDGDGFTDCADQDCFTSLSCYTTCIDLCVAGSTICDGTGVRACAADAATHCLAFGPAQACNNALVCSGGTCVATCSNQCTQGAKTCSNTGGVVECQMLASGCTDWVGPTMCQASEVCSGGACVAQGMCTDQCTAGASRCTAGGQQQSCVMQASGCTDWSFPTACASGKVCTAPGTTCAAPPPCTEGDKRCAASSATVETCDAHGNWATTQTCPQACTAGACTTAAACVAGAVRCSGTDVEICNSSGTAWLFHQTCNIGCNGGLCTDPCTVGATRCNGNVPETCNAAGNAWTAGMTCANGCYQGACMQADLVVDGVTQTLEGDLSFKNDVVIKNGGSLKVGPSGELKIHAHTITVDSASNINGNDVGDSTLCAAASVTGSCTCTWYCNMSVQGPVSTGACHGTGRTGTGAPVHNGCCQYLSGDYTCQPIASGSDGSYDPPDDLSINEGSSSGTTKGGGLVKLVASSVKVDGQITANATGSGASGGGIFIAADTLAGSGALQASGNGDVGVVKLLRGASNGFSGSVTGRKSDSPMPPLDLGSGTHPDPTRWYNDGLGDWSLAWSKPYATANGYYYKVSTDPATLPSQANGNGTFYQQESFVVPAAQLSQGKNFFHLVSVDAAFNVGIVKATASVQINTQPPTVTSSSHPKQKTWYQNNALYFTWTNPQDDANFTGYDYVLDQHADTVPTATMQNFTSNKQVLLANTADGIWVFHLVNRDTRGAITKAAQHYTVYVGTEPAKENLSGSVFDASNASAPLSGVTLTVNGGLFSTSTTSSGTYTFGGSVYVGHWDVTASKAGYVSQTKTVDLMAGTPLNENFTLMKTN